VRLALFFLGLLYLLSPGARAQEVVIPAEMITSDSGMAAEWVLSMLQDHAGFIWFGTNLGVARHDGLKYKIFRRANTLPNPLSNDYIYSMAEDATGDIWLGTGNGLNRFHRASETFTAFFHDPRDPGSLTGDLITCLVPCSLSPDSLWVVTVGGGLGIFNTKTGRCRSFRSDPSQPGSLASNYVHVVYEDQRRQAWVGTAKGFQRFRPATGDFETFRHDPQNANTIGNDNVFEIFESNNQPGILWIGTGGNCLNRFDADRRSWQRFLLPPAELPDPFSNIVFFISECPNEPEMLLVGARQGLYMFHRSRHTWQRIILQDQFREKGDPRNEFVLGIFRDRSGACWVGIQGRGLFKFLMEPEFFRSYVNPSAGFDPIRRNTIRGMGESADGRLWLGTAAGLFLYAPDTGTYDHYTLAPALPARERFDFVSLLCCTRGGDLWAATAGGLVRFSPRTGEQLVFAAREGDPETLGFTAVASICEDARGDVWIGSDFCLLRWDSQARSFRRYLHDPGDAGSLSASHINPILEDREGNLWIGTENGLNLYDRKGDRFSRFYLDPPDPSKETQNYVMILHQDIHGRIWVATSNGLNLMERSGDDVRFEHFSAPGSTLNNFILGVTEDDEENLWLSSPGGLSRFNMLSRTFSLYGSRDRVPHIEFIYKSCLRSRSGELFFGGVLGMFSFKPWQAHFNRYVPPLAFTDIRVWRKPVAIGGDSPLPRSITLAPDLDLSHDQNSLTLSFAALSFIQPDKNQYCYRLDGRDGSWHDLGFEHSINLDNLKPGRYRLRVRGSNNEGVWNLSGITLALRIRPPFWQTWWFRTLLLLALVVFFWQWYRTRIRRLAARIKSETAMDHYFDKFGISPREREIVHLLMRGKSNKEIEDTLFISMGTVKNHIYSIFQKLEVKNRGQLIALFKNLQVK
jgi:ligand-binding sensor domain-containing protein/DNA-binding CsgD family transcriptional regulator